MVRVFVVFLSAFFFLSSAYAQLQRPVSGVVAATSGKIDVRYIAPDGKEIGRTAGIGDPIYLDDEITTGPDTSLQILLKDQTVFTIGPNAVLVFDEFIYDPAGNEAGSLSASVKKGAFKFVSGKISKKSPEAMKLKLPNATASIRGTTVAGRVRDDGESDVILLSGAINLVSVVDPVGVDIVQPGWGASISNLGALSDPFQLTAEALDSILEEASVEAPLSEQEEGQAPSGEAENALETPQITLTAQEQVIADFADDVSQQLAADGQTEVSIDDLFTLILANSDLIAQLEAQGLDITQAPTDISYAYLDTQLVSMLASGASPEYMVLLSDGAGGHYFNHVDTEPDLSNLISESYSGSVRFTSSGLAFAPSSPATSASGTASYDYAISYGNAKASGYFTITGLEIDGTVYGDHTHNFANVALVGRPQASYPGDSDSDLKAGQEFFEVTVADVIFGSGSDQVHAQMNSSLGSITNGSDVVDGILGSTNIMVHDTFDDDKSARVEKHEVGRREN
ncbi:MAG: FecR family protein [Candidatus Puniceispirillaceae bacterium]